MNTGEKVLYFLSLISESDNPTLYRFITHSNISSPYFFKFDNGLQIICNNSNFSVSKNANIVIELNISN